MIEVGEASEEVGDEENDDREEELEVCGDEVELSEVTKVDFEDTRVELFLVENLRREWLDVE